MGLTVLIFSQPITIRLAALRAHYARPCIGIDVETFGTFRKPKRREFDESARKRATKIQSNGSPHKPTVTTFQRYADPKVSIKEAVDADQILESIKNVESLSKTMRKPKRKISFSPKSDESMKDSSAVSKESQNSPLLKIDDSLAREIERQAMVLRMRKFFNTTPIEPELPPPIQFIRKYVEDPDDETDQMRAIRKKKEKESLLLAPVKRSRGKLTFSKFKSENEEEKDRPFTLPAGKFKPKQSLGQNFLSDQNYVLKICDAFNDGSAKGKNVVEIGPGPGALTRVLYSRYPSMTAIEVDERAVEFLHEKLPGLNVHHLDVLKADWPLMAADKGGPLNVIANLPYYIVSQVLFSLADSHRAVDTAVLTMQLEVALRIIAKPSSKEYGIPSVVFQLYGAPTLNFLIPPSVFYPKPKVDSALLTLDFRKPNPALYRVDGDHLRRILTATFQKRRKMLRHSLKDLLLREGFTLHERWATKRPEELTPEEFVQLTIELFGENAQPERSLPPAPLPVLTPTVPIRKKIKIVSAPNISGPRSKKREAEIVTAAAAADAIAEAAEEVEKLVIAERNAAAAVIAAEALAIFEAASKERITYVTRPIWRMSLFGASGTRGYGMNQEEEVVEKERLEDKRLQREQRKLDIEEEERFLLGYDD